jgi:hypothetical protein
MPTAIEFSAERRGVVFHGSGVLTGQEIIDAKEGLAADEARVRPLTFALVLLVDVTAFHITVDELRIAAIIDRRLAELMPHAAVAIVAPRDHEYGIARMWEAIVEVPGWTTYVFREREKAETWLRSVVAPPEPAA